LTGLAVPYTDAMSTSENSRTASPKTQARDERRAQEALQKQVRDYLSGLPRFNIGALFLPPIWGPAHGMFLTLLWYPAWLFADNVFFAAYSVHSTLSYVVAILTGIILTAFTFVFSYAMQPRAAIHCIECGKTKEQFQRRQRIWAVVSVIVGLLMLAAATYYNLCVRTPMGA
jgi:hypothetical protein